MSALPDHRLDPPGQSRHEDARDDRIAEVVETYLRDAAGWRMLSERIYETPHLYRRWVAATFRCVVQGAPVENLRRVAGTLADEVATMDVDEEERDDRNEP